MKVIGHPVYPAALATCVMASYKGFASGILQRVCVIASHNKGSASWHHTIKGLRHCITQKVCVIASHNKGFTSLHHTTKGLRHCIIQQRVCVIASFNKGLPHCITQQRVCVSSSLTSHKGFSCFITPYRMGTHALLERVALVVILSKNLSRIHCYILYRLQRFV